MHQKHCTYISLSCLVWHEYFVKKYVKLRDREGVNLITCHTPSGVDETKILILNPTFHNNQLMSRAKAQTRKLLFVSKSLSLQKG